MNSQYSTVAFLILIFRVALFWLFLINWITGGPTSIMILASSLDPLVSWTKDLSVAIFLTNPALVLLSYWFFQSWFTRSALTAIMASHSRTNERPLKSWRSFSLLPNTSSERWRSNCWSLLVDFGGWKMTFTKNLILRVVSAVENWIPWLVVTFGKRKIQVSKGVIFINLLAKSGDGFTSTTGFPVLML